MTVTAQMFRFVLQKASNISKDQSLLRDAIEETRFCSLAAHIAVKASQATHEAQNIIAFQATCCADVSRKSSARVSANTLATSTILNADFGAECEHGFGVQELQGLLDHPPHVTSRGWKQEPVIENACGHQRPGRGTACSKCQENSICNAGTNGKRMHATVAGLRRQELPSSSLWRLQRPGENVGYSDVSVGGRRSEADDLARGAVWRAPPMRGFATSMLESPSLMTCSSSSSSPSSPAAAASSIQPSLKVKEGMSSKAAMEYFSLLCKGLPLEVKETGDAGRGLFASEPIREGHVFLSAAPVVAHPTLAAMEEVCYLCLRRFPGNAVSDDKGLIDHHGCDRSHTVVASQEPDGSLTRDVEEAEDGGQRQVREEEGRRRAECNGRGDADGMEEEETREGEDVAHWRQGGGGVIFCSTECQKMAEEDFFTIEKSVDWRPLMDYCSQHRLKFPLVARRFALMVLCSAASANALTPLCFVDTGSQVPDQWLHEHRLLLSCLSSSPLLDSSRLSFLTPFWYASVVSRLHLNSFRVELLPSSNPQDANQQILSLDSSALLLAAMASVAGDAAVGSALYLLPSFFNHDCDPNVDVFWELDATAHFKARRNISKGEELSITYLDSSWSTKARQDHLKGSYGFVCHCARCQDEEIL